MRNMPRSKKNQFNFSKRSNKKISLEDIPLKTMRVTLYALRWMFLLIFLFITMGILALFATGGQNYVQMIIGYSITGFFSFFMGFFGWTLAQGVIEMLTGKEEASMIRGLSYYLKKNKKHRF
jgi:hypothetical protein